MCALTFVANAAEQNDEQYMNQLEFKLKERLLFMEVLNQKGPQAYIEARKLKLSKEDRKSLLKDLSRLLQHRAIPNVYIDRKNKVLIISDDKGQSAFDITLLKTGYLKSKDSIEFKLSEITYSQLKDLL